MSSALTDEIEKETEKALQEELEKEIQANIKKGMSREAAEAAAKTAQKDTAAAAAETVVADAEANVQKGTASEAQKTLADYAKKAGAAILANPKRVIGAMTAATVAYHMYKNKESDPLKAMAEMAGEDANAGLGAFFGPFKNWILGGLGVIFLVLLSFLLYKLTSSVGKSNSNK
jgi:hypothetical protein